MVPDDDQAMVLPCASVMVIMVLLNDAATCATPDAMFFFSRRRTRVASLPILNPFAVHSRQARTIPNRHCGVGVFFLPAMVLAGPLRVRALVWVRWPRTGRPLRWRKRREQPTCISPLMFTA